MLIPHHSSTDGPRGRLTSRPAEVATLAALLVGASACLLVGVLFPMRGHAPLGLGKAFTLVGLALAAAVWTLGARLPRGCLLGVAFAALALNSVLVSHAATAAGIMTDALVYVWLGFYVAMFFPSVSAAFGALTAAGFGAGILVSGVGGLTAPWLVLSLTAAGTTIVVARLSRAVRRDLSTDPLTGALNRAGLRAATDELARRRRRVEQDAVVVVIDLDAFKQVNDHQGHATGDRLLSEAVRAWRSVLRADDLLARIGGDEFVLVLPRTDAAEADEVLDRLRVAEPILWSAGLAEWAPGEPLEAALARADEHLYAVKRARVGV